MYRASAWSLEGYEFKSCAEKNLFTNGGCRTQRTVLCDPNRLVGAAHGCVARTEHSSSIPTTLSLTMDVLRQILIIVTCHFLGRIPLLCCRSETICFGSNPAVKYRIRIRLLISEEKNRV
jgi:hypothetical protein